ncbi:MAG: hypothetical protein IJ129_05525, partial [Ruminococcus sp.]|nr:hypothetical protein [Ruminococcus sp.]
MPGKADPVKLLTITIQGCSVFTEEYEVRFEDNTAELSIYEGRWKFDDDASREDFLSMRRSGGEEYAQALRELLRKYHVVRWDGFEGYNIYVLDGEHFRMTGETVSGKKLYATGSNSFPKGFR